ncbi:Acyl carrier protein (ACP1) [hydrothermal vent metagenome]|uniref:Acyl carrier protein (ACP1) n=1 Tax=hydrothermal vent metagenome TaxID=652676 RepID=A0A3B1BVU0_9ZZZZ
MRSKVKRMIIETLNLEDVSPEEIVDEEPLFGEGLGLDSIDALELIVEIDRRFSVKLEDREEATRIFSTVATLADYISANQPG